MARAIDLAPVLRDLQRKGLSLRDIAAELTKRKVLTTTRRSMAPCGARPSAHSGGLTVVFGALQPTCCR